MRDYVIVTDSASDLPKEILKEYDIPCLPLYYSIDGVIYGDEKNIEPHEFFELMRKGAMPTTMGCNPEYATEMFRSILNQGKDILHIAFSSALSVSYNSARIAAEDLKEEFPDSNIVVIDSKAASLGQGLLVYKAATLKKEGKSLEEVKTWIEENLNHMCHYFTVDDLFHLHRGGRVSKTTAVVGTLIHVKPVLHVTNEGELKPFQNVRGRKKALQSLVDSMKKEGTGYENKVAFIVHGDCIEDANKVADKIKEECGVEKVIIGMLSPTIGTHAGPGTVGLFFIGENK